MTVDEIKWFQTELNKLGSALDVDGDLGPLTEAAVKVFQKAHGLREDGIPGPLTKAAIEAAQGGRHWWDVLWGS